MGANALGGYYRVFWAKKSPRVSMIFRSLAITFDNKTGGMYLN